MVGKAFFHFFSIGFSFFLITFATIYKEIFVIVQTEVALVLGLLFYLPPLSIFVIYNILRNRNKALTTKLIQTAPESLLFFVFGLFFRSE